MFIFTLKKKHILVVSFVEFLDLFTWGSFDVFDFIRCWFVQSKLVLS